MHYFYAPFSVDWILHNWLEWTCVRLTLIEQVHRTPSMEKLQRRLELCLPHFKVVPQLFYLKCYIVGSGRAHSQNRTIDALYIGNLRMMCGTAHSRCWTFLIVKSDCTLSEVCFGSLYTKKFNIIFVDCTENVRGITGFL